MSLIPGLCLNFPVTGQVANRISIDLRLNHSSKFHVYGRNVTNKTKFPTSHFTGSFDAAGIAEGK